MSTNTQVRTAWKEGVFNHLVPVKSYDHFFTYDSEEQDPSKGYTKGELNHWQYQVSSIETPLMYKRNQIEFTVRVIRIIEDDPDGKNQNKLLDDFTSMMSYAKAMGESWSSTIDLRTQFPNEIRVDSIRWGDTPALRSEVVFKGVQEVAP